MIYENIGLFANKLYCFSAFVDNAQCFPQPLSKDEEVDNLKKVKQGDKKARDLIITHNLRLVAHIAKKFPFSMEADDIISVGTIGLIKAVDSFDVEKGTKFATYASRCIENEILMLLRANKKHKDVVSLSSTFVQEDDNDMDLEHTLSVDDGDDIINQIEQNYMVSKIDRVMDKELKPMEQQVIRSRYGMNGGDVKTQKEVAKELGISRSYVSRIETKALATIKKEMPQEPEKF